MKAGSVEETIELAGTNFHGRVCPCKLMSEMSTCLGTVWGAVLDVARQVVMFLWHMGEMILK